MQTHTRFDPARLRTYGEQCEERKQYTTHTLSTRRIKWKKKKQILRCDSHRIFYYNVYLKIKMFEGKMKLDLIVLYLSAVLFHTFCLHLFNRTTMLVIILYIKTILLNLRTHMSHVRIFPCCFGLAFVKFCSLYEYE